MRELRSENTVRFRKISDRVSNHIKERRISGANAAAAIGIL